MGVLEWTEAESMRSQNEQPKVSIIVPVYNVDKYLGQCLESLVSQTLNEIEIIVINDGSTDTSWSIIQAYAKRDSRILPLNQSNAGVALTRKRGVFQARGEYIGFVDSDDWVDDKMFERLYDVAKEQDADAVECNKHGDTPTAWDGVYSQVEFLRIIAKPHLLCGREASLPWNRIYRNTELLKKFDYGPPPLYEDYLFNLQFFLYVKKYVKLPDSLYHYRVVPGSLSKRYNERTFDALKNSHLVKLRLLPEYGWNTDADLLTDAHWFLQNMFNIVNVLFSSTCPVSYKLKEAKRLILDGEVQSAVSVLKMAHQLQAQEKKLLTPMWFAIRALVLSQMRRMVQSARGKCRKYMQGGLGNRRQVSGIRQT